MTVSAENSGTQSATVGTEHFVEDTNTIGTFTFHVDLINMVAGDIVEIRVYSMLLTGGTARVAYFQPYEGVQPADGSQMPISAAISNELTDSQALRFSIKQTHGTSRNFPWKVLKHA